MTGTLKRTVKILVDHANLAPSSARPGKLVSLIDDVLNKVGPFRGEDRVHARVRLYGGWYERDQLTRDAQDLIGAIGVNFPRSFRVERRGITSTFIVAAELAHGLAAQPTSAITFTYRPRDMPRGLMCAPPTAHGCTAATCPLSSLPAILSQNICSTQGCRVKASDVISRGGQKLVDTVITADLIYFAGAQERNLAVVSSDDDMWAGIVSACSLGATVFHLHTRANHRTRPEYRTLLARGRYQERAW